MKQLPSKFRQRWATASLWTTSNPILYEGEFGIESDTGRYKIGNGVSPWINLPYNTNHKIECLGFTTSVKGAMAQTSNVQITIAFNIPVKNLVFMDLTEGKQVLEYNGQFNFTQTITTTLKPGHTYAVKVPQTAKNISNRPSYVYIQLDKTLYFERYVGLVYTKHIDDADAMQTLYFDPTIEHSVTLKNVKPSTGIRTSELLPNIKLYVNGIQGGFSQTVDSGSYLYKPYHEDCGLFDVTLTWDN